MLITLIIKNSIIIENWVFQKNGNLKLSTLKLPLLDSFNVEGKIFKTKYSSKDIQGFIFRILKAPRYSKILFDLIKKAIDNFNVEGVDFTICLS